MLRRCFIISLRALHGSALLLLLWRFVIPLWLNGLVVSPLRTIDRRTLWLSRRFVVALWLCRFVITLWTINR